MTPEDDLGFADEVAALRPVLTRIARRRLRNPVWADDAVSETLLAALERPGSFDGRAKTLTWLVGILKHKLIDQVRRQARECELEALRDDEDAAAFDPLDHALARHDAAPAWGDPHAALERRQFVREVDAAIAALPAQQSRAFILREALEQDTGEVCRTLGVTPNHLGVILHRARLRLRASLAPQWGGGMSAAHP